MHSAKHKRLIRVKPQIPSHYFVQNLITFVQLAPLCPILGPVEKDHPFETYQNNGPFALVAFSLEQTIPRKRTNNQTISFFCNKPLYLCSVMSLCPPSFLSIPLSKHWIKCPLPLLGRHYHATCSTTRLIALTLTPLSFSLSLSLSIDFIRSRSLFGFQDYSIFNPFQ